LRALGDGKLLQQGKPQLGKAAKWVASSELSEGECESEQSHQRYSVSKRWLRVQVGAAQLLTFGTHGFH
jgi:hypothetical protein